MSDGGYALQNGEIGGILKQLTGEVSADLRAVEEEEFGQRTIHQGLAKSKIEEISVLTKTTEEVTSVLDAWDDDAANEPEDVAQLLMVSRQADDSEHFPINEGRNLNPEPEFCTPGIYQACTRDSQSFEPGSGCRCVPGETNRPV